MSTARRLKPPVRHASVEEYLSGPPDEFKSELIYGELVVCPRPTDEHQDLVHDLGEVLKRWTRFHKLGKVSFDIDMVLDEEKNLVYAPDLLFVATAHEKQRRQGRLYGPADLCAEVLSPFDKPRTLRRKFTDYERYRVAWYWIIDPDGPTLEEYELVDDVYFCRSEANGDDWFEPGLFPELQLRLSSLIAGDIKAAVKGKAKKLV